MPGKDKNKYTNNIYVKNYEEIKKLTGVLDLMSVADRKLLGI